MNDITVRPESALAQAIVQLSRTLGMSTVAEGVESATQADALRRFGCELAQGFHLGRPVDAEATRRLLRDRASV